MNKDSVLFKNSPDRLLLVLDKDELFENLLEEIKEKVMKNMAFFKGYSLSLKYKGRALTPSEEDAVSRIFMDAGSIVNSISEEIDERPARSEMAGQSRKVQSAASTKKKSARTMVKGYNEGMVRFFNSTIRSGQTIDFDGNVVILGDINPGAEVRASGNIIVFGKIRGSIAAGTSGNDEAFIIGRGIHPSSITISDIKAIPPDEEDEPGRKLLKGLTKKRKTESCKELEIAYIRNGTIYIELYDDIY